MCHRVNIVAFCEYIICSSTYNCHPMNKLQSFMHLSDSFLLGLFLIALGSYNPAVAVPPASWPVPPRPQPWFPQRPPVSVPPAPVGLVQQPLFPIQNVRPSVPSTMSPAFPPSLPPAPPGLPPVTPVAVSQPLFPVVANNNNIPTQISPFSTPMLSTSIQSSSPLDLKSSIDSTNASAASTYHPLGIQGLSCLLIISF